MRQFADQCLDLAQLILGQRLGSLERESAPAGEKWEDGAVAGALTAYVAQASPGVAAEETFVEVAAQRIAAQFYYGGDSGEGCALAALALVHASLNRARNEVWKRLTPEMQALIRSWMRTPLPSDRPGEKIYAVVQAIVAGAMGFVEKDNSDALMGSFLEYHAQEGFVDTATAGLGGRYDASGLLRLMLFREALQRHANVHIRERRLPTLRTCLQRYLRLLPQIVSSGGDGWAYGLPQGPLATASCCSLIACSMADGWIGEAERESYADLLGRLFRHFFLHHLNREEGCIVGVHSNGEYFAVVRQLLLCSQFGRLVRDKFTAPGTTAPSVPCGGRFLSFDSSTRKEQGLWVYRGSPDGPVLQLPLVGGDGVGSCAHLAFPHCCGLVDGPAEGRRPVFVPELTWEGTATTPSHFGKNITSGLGKRREFQFRYEQPDLITPAEEMVPGLASCRVQWTFCEDQIRAEFLYSPKRTVRLDRFSYAVAFLDGQMADGTVYELRPEVLLDDFHGEWQPPLDVSQDPRMRTVDGRQIQHLIFLERLLPLQLQPNRSYGFSVVLHLERVPGQA
ncbi:MAG: hypothetical protein LBT98_04085 [Puniceicoccales bacterium]|jgi:hypothetical protein|nr:hypothetical protein [Puniceicoccales bacterium]